MWQFNFYKLINRTFKPMPPLQTEKQALTLALQLAMTAPSVKLSHDCIEMADFFAEKLTPSEIEECKKAAKVHPNRPINFPLSFQS